MFISTFDLFRIGIGPSSSHTVAPMRAARRFLSQAAERRVLASAARVRVELYGSLGWTGRGHGTDNAILLGLCGHAPETVDPDRVVAEVETIRRCRQIRLLGRHCVPFVEAEDLRFDLTNTLPFHPNAVRFDLTSATGGLLLTEIFYSIGGGFIVTEQEGRAPAGDPRMVPYPFSSGGELLAMARNERRSIAELMLDNERSLRSAAEVSDGLTQIWSVMDNCIERGCRAHGELAGGLRVQRRAAALLQTLTERSAANARAPHEILDWVSLFAIAVNEENAAGSRVVTAPTNGAAGVVPAVLRYYHRFCPGTNPSGTATFLLTAAAIGSLIKRNASISGAEVGCQGEVGSASAMAAAGLAAVLGGTAAQVENAAEIALEHHLGMTCDPVGGLVQIPCIERNAMGAVKGINAASLALAGDGHHRVTLDQAIETMRQTGRDMQTKYKETAQGGLALNVVEC